MDLSVKRVLVVDDDQDAQGFLSLVLSDSGYLVDTASHGAEALVKVERLRFDLVVLDLMMPVMDGWGFLKRLKDIPDPPAVVILSAAPDEWRAFRSGAWECVSKPIVTSQFLETCRRALYH